MVGTEFQILQHGHEREQSTTLGHHHQTAFGGLMRGQVGDVVAVKHDAPGFRPQMPADGQQQGGFASTVGPHHRKDLTLAHIKRDAFQYWQLAITGPQRFYAQYGTH